MVLAAIVPDAIIRDMLMDTTILVDHIRNMPFSSMVLEVMRDHMPNQSLDMALASVHHMYQSIVNDYFNRPFEPFDPFRFYESFSLLPAPVCFLPALVSLCPFTLFICAIQGFACVFIESVL
jgi:hypothetical protein